MKFFHGFIFFLSLSAFNCGYQDGSLLYSTKAVLGTINSDEVTDYYEMNIDWTTSVAPSNGAYSGALDTATGAAITGDAYFRYSGTTVTYGTLSAASPDPYLYLQDFNIFDLVDANTRNFKKGPFVIFAVDTIHSCAGVGTTPTLPVTFKIKFFCNDTDATNFYSNVINDASNDNKKFIVKSDNTVASDVAVVGNTNVNTLSEYVKGNNGVCTA